MLRNLSSHGHHDDQLTVILSIESIDQWRYCHIERMSFLRRGVAMFCKLIVVVSIVMS